MAIQARKVADLDEIIFLPCRRSPHKPENPLAHARHRVEMIRIATKPMSWAEVSCWEINRVPPSYSWMAAEHFHDTFPQADLFWIIGNDQWDAIHTWYKPARLAELLTFIVFPRGKQPVEKNGFRTLFINTSHPASSSETRDRLTRCKSTSNLLARNVAAYIAEHQIYAPELLTQQPH